MHPLLTQVRSVARQARRLVLRAAFARWLCVVMLMVFAMATADYLFRFRELPLRWLSFVAVIAVAAWSWRRSVSPVLALQWSDRQVAQFIEQGIPELRDRLSSAVSFLHLPANDSRFGSEKLRADMVQRTAAAIANRNLAGVLVTDHSRRALQVLLVVMIVIGAICALDANSAVLAVRRLGMPWSHEAWPRKHHLAFTKHPTVLAYGQDFEVELVNDLGRLPSEVTILYWFDGDDEKESRPHRMSFSGGKMTHRLPAVTKPFRYRAVGGDDHRMEWTALRVVVPPRIVESRITVRPPAYSGRPNETTERRIRALAGSTVEAQIQVDKPIAAAVLNFKSNSTQQQFSARPASDGRRWTLTESDSPPWILTASGTYGWQLTDREGMTIIVNDNSEVDVVPDLPPVVSIESPEADATFTARAIVPVRLTVKDDLAIQRVEFRMGETVRILSEYPAPMPSEDTKSIEGHKIHAITHPWDLTDLPDLQPGTILTFEIVAEDFRPQTSAPAGGTIRILSNTEFQQRLNEGEAVLLQRFKEALQQQLTLHNRTGSLVTQLKSANQLTDEDAAAWPGLEPGQRRVAALLGGDDGAARQVTRLLTDLSDNRWEAPQLVTHLTAIQQELSRISDKLLPPIQQRLVEADRQLRFESPAIPKVVQAWSDAASGQEQVVTALESLVDQLGQWDRYRNLAQEVRQVLEEHGALLQETRELPTAGRELGQLTAEERAKLDRIGQQLTDLAAQVDRMQSRLDQIQQRLSQSNPAAAEALKEALKVLEQDPVSGTIREAARSVTDNRLGAATRGLEETSTGLKKLLAALEQRSDQDLQQVEQLIAKAIAGFAIRQEAVIGQTTDWAQQTENPSALATAAQELAKQQSDLAADVNQLARQTPDTASYSLALEFAARPMLQAGQRLAKNQVDETTLKAEREALTFLKDLMASLAKNQRPEKTPDPNSKEQPPPQGSGEQPKSDPLNVAELKLIRLMQLEIMRRTKQLDEVQTTGGKLSPEEQRELSELATRQQRLAEFLERMGTPPANNEVPQTGKPPKNPSGHWIHPLPLGRVQFVSWNQDSSKKEPTTPPKPPAPRNSLDRSLLDDLPPTPARDSKKSAAGEDLGQPSADSPLAELSRQMRQIESLLQGGDTTANTQQMQRRVAAQLTTIIDQLQQQSAGDEAQPQPQRGNDRQENQSNSSTPAKSAKTPGSGSGKSVTDKEAVANWARGVWGVLPDRVRQQIQSLGDEQFLPEYDEIIRQYYDRLSERGRDRSPQTPP